MAGGYHARTPGHCFLLGLVLIAAALADLGIAGIINETQDDPLIIRAVVTFCKANFGEPDEYDRLKTAYDEQKAQLQMATGYTDWGEDDG